MKSHHTRKFSYFYSRSPNRHSSPPKLATPRFRSRSPQKAIPQSQTQNYSPLNYQLSTVYQKLKYVTQQKTRIEKGQKIVWTPIKGQFSQQSFIKTYPSHPLQTAQFNKPVTSIASSNCAQIKSYPVQKVTIQKVSKIPQGDETPINGKRLPMKNYFQKQGVFESQFKKMNYEFRDKTFYEKLNQFYNNKNFN